jgi:hypothetical protein
MVFKSKKINRKKYFTSLQKSQSRKKIYGGDPNSQYNLPPPPELSEPKIKLPPPTLGENIEDVGNLAVSAVTNVAADGINNVAESLGIDPHKAASETIKEIGDKIENVVNVLKSPQGEKIKEEASELISESIDILKPSIEKGQQILEDGIKKLANTGTGIVMTALNEIPPIFLINEASKFATAATQAGETVAELTTTGAEALEKVENQKNKATSLWNNFKGIINNISNNVNEGVSGIVKSAQNEVNKYGQNVIKERFPTTLSTNSLSKISPSIQKAGGTLKNYRKQSRMIGGRIFKAQNDFLKPTINRSHILKQYGGKVTKRIRNRNNNKLTYHKRN